MASFDQAPTCEGYGGPTEESPQTRPTMASCLGCQRPPVCEGQVREVQTPSFTHPVFPPSIIIQNNRRSIKCAITQE
jgi:hypothetical protein